jgi:NAD dependent epimerase/dehydratase family enzyme
MHDKDYCRAVELLLARPEIADASNGIVNMCAPGPLPNSEFQRDLRRAWNMPIGLPASTWMLKIGTRLMGAEPELILISRRVVPTVLLKSGFAFSFPEWPAAAADLVARSRKKSVVAELA